MAQDYESKPILMLRPKPKSLEFRYGGSAAESQDEFHSSLCSTAYSHRFRHGILRLPYRGRTPVKLMSHKRWLHPSVWLSFLHVRIHHVHHNADRTSADLDRKDRFRNGPEAHPLRLARRHVVFRFLACSGISEQKSSDDLRRRVFDVYPNLPAKPTVLEKVVVRARVL